MRRAAPWLVLATAAAMALAGCSDDAGPDAAASPSSSRSGSSASSSPDVSGSPSSTPDTSATDDPSGTSEPGGAATSDPVRTEQETLPPVALEAPADFGSGVQARIADRQAVEMAGRGPGEVSGPALAFTIEFMNATGAAVDLSAATVSVDYGGNEASGFEGAPSQPVIGELAPGAAATGVYVYAVPTDQRTDITVSVSYSASLPIVLFTGDASS